MYKKN